MKRTNSQIYQLSKNQMVKPLKLKDYKWKLVETIKLTFVEYNQYQLKLVPSIKLRGRFGGRHLCKKYGLSEV